MYQPVAVLCLSILKAKNYPVSKLLTAKLETVKFQVFCLQFLVASGKCITDPETNSGWLIDILMCLVRKFTNGQPIHKPLSHCQVLKKVYTKKGGVKELCIVEGVCILQE